MNGRHNKTNQNRKSYPLPHRAFCLGCPPVEENRKGMERNRPILLYITYYYVVCRYYLDPLSIFSKDFK